MMELETLEVYIDANTEKLEKQFAKIAPYVEKTMKTLGMTVDKGIDKAEKEMDVSKGTSKVEKQLEQMNKMFEKQMTYMEQSSEQSASQVGNNMSRGFSKARKTVGKDIDGIVNEINAKMGQAKAQQEKLAFLKSQRQGAVSKQDTSSTVKYDEQIANAQAKLTSYHDTAKKLAKTMKDEYDGIPSTLDAISEKMAVNEGQIESMRSRMKTMQADYERIKTPVGSFSGGFTGTEDNDKSLKMREQIEKQTQKMNKLIQENDALQQAYARTEDKAGSLSIALKTVNTDLGNQSRQTETAGSGVRKFGRNTDQSRGLFSRFSDSLGNIGGVAKKGFGFAGGAMSRFGPLFGKHSKGINNQTDRMSNGMTKFGNRIGRIAKQVFVFSLVYKGLRKVGQGMFGALQTNDQFSQSLNEIKVNLMTAFYPIYTAVLPAINALMSAISTATAYLAQFIAVLFGTTYSAAQQGAQGLYQNIQAMNDTGSQADKTKEKVKQLQRSLMGFDEINTLSMETDSEDSNAQTGLDFNAVNPVIPNDVTGLANQFKKLMNDFFLPFKKSWDTHGKKVIDAWKYALREVNKLVISIGKSFMDVWTNGTGERFIGNILILLADVLNIIGDIAKAFRNAWDDNGRGTAVIQSIFDKWNAVLELLHEIAVAFRNAWNSGEGERIAANLLEIYTNINNIIAGLANSFKNSWKEGAVGESIFTTILKIANNVLDSLNRMTEATAIWAEKLDFTPLLESIDGLLRAIEPLTQSIFDGLAWAYENVFLPLAGFVIEDLLPAFFDLLSGAINVINGVIEVFRPLAEWLFEMFLEPIAAWTGGIIVSVLEGLANILSTIGDWISEYSEIIDIFIVILGYFAAAWGLVTLASEAGAIALNVYRIALEIWNIVAGIATGVSSALGAAIAFLTSPIGIVIIAIGAIIAAGVLLIKHWEEVKEFASTCWEAIKDFLKDTIDNIVSFFTETDWLQLGKDIILGIISGITGMLEKLKETVTGVAGKIVGWFSKKLGIHSPSTVMAEQGEFVVQGVEVGMENRQPDLEDVTGDMTGTITGTFNDIGGGIDQDLIGSEGLNVANSLNDGLETGLDSTPNIVDSTLNRLVERIREFQEPVRQSSSDLGKSFSDGLNEGMRTVDVVVNKLGNQLISILSSYKPKMFKTGLELMQQFDKGLNSGTVSVNKSAQRVGNELVKTLTLYNLKVQKVGRQNMQFYSKGLDSGTILVNKSVQKIGNEVLRVLTSYNPKILKLGNQQMQQFAKGIENTRALVKSKSLLIAQTVYSVLESYLNKINQMGISYGKNLANGLSSTKSLVRDRSHEIGNIILSTITGYAPKLQSAGAKITKSLAAGLKSGQPDVKSAMSAVSGTMLKGIEKGINGSIAGVNFVMGKFGSAQSISKWTIPKYAQGTGVNGHRQDGPALVNDASGANYREAYRLPNGQAGLFPRARNLMVNLPKGTQVLRGSLTAKLARSGAIPAYAKGIGDWDTEIFDYMEKPAELASQAIDKFTDLSKVKQPWKEMTNAAVENKTKPQAGNYLKKFMDSLDFGSGSGSFAPHFGSPFIKSSDYGPRPNLYGDFHTGVDFAAPMGTPLPAQYGGSVAYAGWATGFGNLVGIKVANALYTLYGHMQSISTKVGKSVRKGQPIGAVGSTGYSTGPHVHYELQTGKMFGQHVDPYGYGIPINASGAGSSNNNFGSSVERWRPTVNRSLRMLSQYSTANADSTLYQMKTESGGNPRAINLWDINAMNGTPSKGLMQVIDPTFRAHARAPYNKDIWDPTSNILASMRYAISRYGSLAAAYQGVGYENGGLVSKDGLYRLSEGNKKEMVIPLEKPTRAMELINEAMDYLGIDSGYQTLQLPEMFRTDDFSTVGIGGSGFGTDTTFKTDGMAQMVVNGILTGLQALGLNATQSTSTTGDIVINIGGKEFGRIAVSEINNYHEKLGYTELNL